jgi:hypothetical protein
LVNSKKLPSRYAVSAETHHPPVNSFELPTPDTFTGQSSVVLPSSPPTPSNPKFVLHGQEIKLVKTTMYLGVPFAGSGGQWRTHITQQIESANKLLKFLSVKSEPWPEWVRLQIFKTFVSTQLNYLSPISGIVLKSKTQENKVILDSLNALDDASLKFIFGYATLRSKNAMKSLVSFIPFSSILSNSADLVILQVQKFLAVEDHPWSIMLSKCGGPNTSPFAALIQRLSTTPPVLLKYTEYIANHPSHRTLSLKEFSKVRLIEDQQKLWTINILPRYIMDRCRRSLLSPDPLLYHKDGIERRKMIRWRLNVLPIRPTCEVCDMPWNRGCIYQCKWFESLVHPSETFLLHDITADSNQINQMYPTSEHTYCIFDLLLNNKEYASFLYLYSKLEESLQTSLS